MAIVLPTLSASSPKRWLAARLHDVAERPEIGILTGYLMAILASPSTIARLDSFSVAWRRPWQRRGRAWSESVEPVPSAARSWLAAIAGL